MSMTLALWQVPEDITEAEAEDLLYDEDMPGEIDVDGWRQLSEQLEELGHDELRGELEEGGRPLFEFGWDYARLDTAEQAAALPARIRAVLAALPPEADELVEGLRVVEQVYVDAAHDKAGVLRALL